MCMCVVEGVIMRTGQAGVQRKKCQLSLHDKETQVRKGSEKCVCVRAKVC